MNNSLQELESLIKAWDSLRTARPSEIDLSSWWPGATVDDIDALFDSWLSGLELVTTRTRPADEAEEKIIDWAVAKSLREARARVSEARNNNLAWLGTTAFPGLLATISGHMLSILGKRVGVRRGLIKLAADKTNEQIGSISEAAPLASQIIDYHTNITEAAETISAYLGTAEQDTETVKGLRDKAAANEAEITSIKSALAQQAGEVKRLTGEAAEGAAELKNLLSDVADLKQSADKDLGEGAKQLQAASAKLKKALQDINRQALAGAFHEKAESATIERWIWVAAFSASVIWLGVAGYFLRESLSGLVALSDLGPAMLRGVPMLGPAVWLGWYCARQAGMTARIKEDYSYKAATAVAFEGYKKEAAALGDDGLSTMLLETAIKNFGANPVRLYEKEKDDLGHPIESILASVKDEATWKRLTDLIKVVTPEKKG